MAKKKFNEQDHLYLQVAEGLEKMIGEETLKIGDKLPSVRMLSEEYGISMGTAFQAYYHLEGKGLIEARPKSGYYVRFNFRRMPALPRIAAPEPVTSDVSVHYRGSLISGLEFDSSFARGQPANFKVNEVIKGWSEILPLMRVGDYWRVYVPADMAYGERGQPPRIGPNEALVFELKLVEVK